MIDHTRDWQPIETAPRDGSIIQVTSFEVSGEPFEIHPMQWGHITQNPLFAPGKVGMWVAPGGEYTWREGVGGPTHWRPLAPQHHLEPPPDTGNASHTYRWPHNQETEG